MNKLKKNDKKLIAFLTNSDDDIYCFRKEVIERFLSEGFEILISCPYGQKLDLMKELPYQYDDVTIDRRGMNVGKDFKLLLHYYHLLKRFKPDVVLTYTAKANVYGSLAATLLRIPYMNNVTGLGSVLKQKKLLQKLILFLFQVAFKKSKCVFFQNEENLKLVKRRRLVKGRYRLIPGSGVNTERFPLQPYPEDKNGIIFNYIGRVLKEKGIEDYIEAAKRIRSEYLNTQFNIIGFIEPTELHYQITLAQLQQQGIVRYHGNQIDVKPFIHRAHAIIHPSVYGEGMSNVLLENASSGRPVITTDIAGCREIVTQGVTGFIYQPGNVDELVKKIENFIELNNETRKNMGLAGREKVRAEFSREIVVSAYLEEVNKICQS